MAQIPGVPTPQPIEQPLTSVGQMREAGIGSAVVANQQAERMALTGTELQGRLIEAQNQHDIKHGQISLDKLQVQLHDDLRKSVTPEQVQENLDNYRNQVPNVLAPYSKNSHVSRVLQTYADSEDLRMQDVSNVKKADILTKSDDAANTILGQMYKQEAVAERLGGGDGSIAEGKYELALRSSEAHGTMLPAVANAKLAAWHQDVQIGAVEARMNDPNPAARDELIRDLKAGTGPLVTEIPEGLRTQLLTAAESRDRMLKNLEETQDVNSVFSNLLGYFKSHPNMFSEPESKMGALENPDILKSIGAVTKDGNPDFVMGHKLGPLVAPVVADEVREQESESEKIQNAISAAVANHQYGNAETILRTNLHTIQLPKKYRLYGAKLSEMVKVASRRVDEDIPRRTDLAQRIKLTNEIISGEKDDRELQLDVLKSPVKETTGKELLNFIRVSRDRTIRDALKSSNNYLRSVLAPTQGAIFQALLQGGTVDSSTLSKMNPVEQLEFNKLSSAEEALAAWAIQEHQLAASGKRSSLTHDEIFKTAQEIAKGHMPTMDEKLDAVHQQQKAGASRVYQGFEYTKGSDGQWHRGNKVQ